MSLSPPTEPLGGIDSNMLSGAFVQERRRSALQVRDVEETDSVEGDPEPEGAIPPHDEAEDTKAGSSEFNFGTPKQIVLNDQLQQQPALANDPQSTSGTLDVVKLVDFLQMTTLLSSVNDTLQEFLSSMKDFRKSHSAGSDSPSVSSKALCDVVSAISAENSPAALLDLSQHVDVLLRRVEQMSETLSKTCKRVGKPYAGPSDNVMPSSKYHSGRGGAFINGFASTNHLGGLAQRLNSTRNSAHALPRPESKLPTVAANFAPFENFTFGTTPPESALVDRPFCDTSRMNSAASLTGQVAYPDAVETAEVVIDKDAEGNKLINNYIVIGQLGRGMYGKVKLAEHRTSHQTVALKVLNKSLLRKMKHGGTNGMQQVQAEIAIMKKLRHRNVVCLYEVIDDPGSNKLYLVMQYIAKGAIMKLSDDGSCIPLEEHVVRDYARQLASGLTYLHRHNIVHRDIKPDNILLDNDDNVYLSDFGVSEMLDSEGDGMVTGSQGTPAFFSPELCRGEGAVHGKAVDIWALGVTLFVLLFGKLPFFGSNVEEIMSNIQNTSLQFPADADPDWKNLLSQMLNKDPNKRLTAMDLRHHPLLGGAITPRPLQAENSVGLDKNGLPRNMGRRRASDFDLLTIDDNDLNNAITVGAGIELQLHQTPQDRIMRFVEKVRDRVRKKREDAELQRANHSSPFASMRKPAPPGDPQTHSPPPRNRHSQSLVKIDMSHLTPPPAAGDTVQSPPDTESAATEAIKRFSHAVEQMKSDDSAGAGIDEDLDSHK